MNMTADKRTGKDRPFGKAPRQSSGQAQDKLHGRKTLQVTNFLDEFEKDDVKRYVDIVELFHHFGVTLTKKGKSYMAQCPWHKDTTPSLSVDREKGVYNCFGCGESGDIFTLTEKMKGCDFKEALSFLKELKGSPVSKVLADSVTGGEDDSSEEMDESEEILSPSSTASGAAHITVKEHENDAASDAAPESPNADGLTLTTVADHYHKKLFESEKALDYLKTRGFSRLELYTRFRIGYADGSLLSMIGENQKRKLQHIGILTEKGHEHFRNCVTFPIVDDLNQVVGTYGRSVDPSAKIQHLYLKGKHRGIFNRKASKVYDEVVLTESIIDAFSLIELGIENVQSIYGTNGFTDEHLQLLKDDRVKTMVLALDNDEPGREASGKLKEKLMAEGFAVKEIAPPELPGLFAEGENALVKDWNEYLAQGLSTASPEELKELVKKAIRKAEEHRAPASSTSALKVVEDAASYTFTVGDVSYRVTGMKELFVGSLRVNVKAELKRSSEDESAREPNAEKYYDNLDLYSARSRASYALNLSKAFGIEPKRIERDLINILEYLEAVRDRKLRGEDAKTVEMSPEERELGLSLLRDERLFERIVEDMEVLGYVGEDLNKQLIYLAASSRKLDNPLSVLIVSGSAAGKSFIVDTVKELLPPEEVLALTSLSDQALNYAEALDHKFLSLGEAVHSEPVEHQIREIISGKCISRLVTVKDQKTGKLASTLVQSPAAVSMVITGTKYDINPENASRFFVVNVDESRAQTRRIHELQRKSFRVENLHRRRTLLPEIIRSHRAAQRLLRPLFTVIPFAEHIDFPDTLMRARRDQARFLDLIACVSYLRQFQKEIMRDGAVEYLEADLEDYEIAREILVKGVLASTMREIPRGSIDLYEEFRRLATKRARREDLTSVEVTVSQRELREETGLGHSWIKQHLRYLVEFEYLLAERRHARGSRGAYRLREDAELPQIAFAMIPTREELETRVNGRKDEHDN
ncbi:MAG TPA: CHC2 zinc finger domain-containing protein [Spirochaetota bacterium]|nr:CHC2 zinc finger domain-containing protein [Spirochaetota bacterium]